MNILFVFIRVIPSHDLNCNLIALAWGRKEREKWRHWGECEEFKYGCREACFHIDFSAAILKLSSHSPSVFISPLSFFLQARAYQVAVPKSWPWSSLLGVPNSTKKNVHLLRVHYVLRVVWSTFHILSHLVLTKSYEIETIIIPALQWGNRLRETILLSLR